MQPTIQNNNHIVPGQEDFIITADRREGWSLEYTGSEGEAILIKGEFLDPENGQPKLHQVEREGVFRVAAAEGVTNNWHPFGSRIISKNWTVQIWVESAAAPEGTFVQVSLTQGKARPEVKEPRPRADEIFPKDYADFLDRVYEFYKLEG